MLDKPCLFCGYENCTMLQFRDSLYRMIEHSWNYYMGIIEQHTIRAIAQHKGDIFMGLSLSDFNVMMTDLVASQKFSHQYYTMYNLDWFYQTIFD